MKSRYSSFMLWASIMAGVGVRHQMNVETKPTGGHRRRGYIPDENDAYRIAFAKGRRERRALNRYGNKVECVANNPCYKEHKSCVLL